ncbi:MAG: 4-(cytidine 5'-diphospho)-2-C-methyl-D-erythritol kinase [Pseudomonadota bacterium]
MVSQRTKPDGLLERAPAKINLTLQIHGRLPNGYHALSSVVAFADVADLLTVARTDPAQSSMTPVTDHLSEALPSTDRATAPTFIDDNLIDRARTLLLRTAPHLDCPAVTLDKHLPIAAGLGGGSADAAAYLRLVQRLNRLQANTVDWASCAAALGADVPVCLAGTACLMEGVGDVIAPIAWPAPTPAVLCNPRVPVPVTKTRDVFRALGAPAIAEAPSILRPQTACDVMELIRSGRNDLTDAAVSVIPAISEVIDALAQTDDVVLTRLSGAGPTAFALYETSDAAERAAALVSADHPAWWVVATKLS